MAGPRLPAHLRNAYSGGGAAGAGGAGAPAQPRAVGEPVGRPSPPGSPKRPGTGPCRGRGRAGRWGRSGPRARSSRAVVDQREEEGLPFGRGASTFCTPTLWEAVAVQALRWQLKGRGSGSPSWARWVPSWRERERPRTGRRGRPSGRAARILGRARAQGPAGKTMVLHRPDPEGWRQFGRAAAAGRWSFGTAGPAGAAPTSGGDALPRPPAPGGPLPVPPVRWRQLDPRRAAEALAEASGSLLRPGRGAGGVGSSGRAGAPHLGGGGRAAPGAPGPAARAEAGLERPVRRPEGRRSETISQPRSSGIALSRGSPGCRSTARRAGPWT